MKTLKITVLLLFILQLTAVASDDSFGNDRANVWVDNGVNSRTYHYGEWSANADLVGGDVKVGTEVITTTEAPEVNILVNNTPTSYPLIKSELPDISLVGLDPQSDEVGDPMDKATLVLSPSGGDFNDTLEVQIELVSVLGDTQTIEYKVDENGVFTEKTLVVADGNSTMSLFLSKNGTHTIYYKFKDDVDTQSATFTITNADIKRDSDGDGLPDIVESELGTNPFLVSDDNNWSAFDRYIRNDDLNDTDGDGWSDFDERVLRGTEYDNAYSKPTATSLYGVEYKISSYAQENDINKSSLYRVSFVDLQSTLLYDSKDLESLNILETYFNTEITDATNSYLTALLSQGDIPTVRMPASTPIIERVRESGESDSWVAKRYIASSENRDVVKYYEEFVNDSNITDFNLSSFANGYIAYLQENLVVQKDIQVDDMSSFAVGVAELVLRTRGQSDATLILGHPDFPYNIQAYENTLLSLNDTNRTVNDLYNDLYSLLATNSLDFSDLETYMANDANLTEIGLAHYMQDVVEEDIRYQLSLMSIVDFATALTQSTTFASKSVFLSDIDSDGDNLLNKDEVLSLLYSNPLEADSDGDGFSDGVDPCINDADNSCLNDDIANIDSDGDGVVDSVDNCPFHANSSQSDADNDGIGDSCAKEGIVISTPRTNIVVLKNDIYMFKAVVTSENGGDVSWFVDGKVKEEDTLEFSYQFFTKGTQQICANLKYLDSNAQSCIYVKVEDIPSSSNPVSLYAAAIKEGDSGEKNVLVEVSLANPADIQMVYDYSTSDYLAVKNEDYRETSGTLVFNINDVRKYIEVPIIGDTEFETDESFIVSLVQQNGDDKADVSVNILNDDAAPDTGDSNETQTLLKEWVYFAFDDVTNGIEPWVSDGSEANTTLLSDLVVGSMGSYPSNFTKTSDGNTYFTANNSDYNLTLHRTQGSEDSTMSLGILEGNSASDFVDMNGSVYFILSMDAATKLYKITGDTYNYITDLSSDYMTSEMKTETLQPVGDKIFMTVDMTDDNISTVDLYKIDTLSDEISLVKDIKPSEAYYSVENFVASSQRAFFTVNSQELWQSLGTDESTTMLKAVSSENEYITSVKQADNILYYATVNYDTGDTVVFSYDITSGTENVIGNYDSNTSFYGLENIGDSVYMMSTQAEQTYLSKLSSTGVTTSYASTDYIYDVIGIGERFIVSSDRTVFADDETVLFTTSDSVWIEIVKDTLADKFFFIVHDYTTNTISLYVTDGTASGTNEIINLSTQ